jgi:hypothetical protein
LAHQLLHCPALAPARARAVQLWVAHMASRPHLLPVVQQHTLGAEEDMVSFLLDPSSCPGAILAAREHHTIFADLFYLARVWCHGAHTLRIKLLRLNGHI